MVRGSLSRVVIAAGLIASALLGACTSEPTGASALPGPQSAAASRSVEIAFAGDVHFTEHVAALLAAPRESRLSRVKALMSGADVSVVNFESAIAIAGKPAPKVYHFRAPASALTALAEAGIDVVSMANNHSVDFGDVGLRQTLAAIARHQGPAAAAPRVAGFGRTSAEAMSPALIKAKGLRIAVFAATAIPDWTAAHHSAAKRKPGVNSVVHSDTALVAAIKKWRPKVDLVIAFMHWGVEYTTCPKRAEQSRARDLVGAGADLVIGSHPHIQQGVGMMGKALVAYSLGNFIWFLNDRQDRASTGVLHVLVRGRQIQRAWWVATHTLDSGEPAKVSNRTWLARVRRELDERRVCASLARPRGWSVQ